MSGSNIQACTLFIACLSLLNGGYRSMHKTLSHFPSFWKLHNVKLSFHLEIPLVLANFNSDACTFLSHCSNKMCLNSQQIITVEECFLSIDSDVKAWIYAQKSLLNSAFSLLWSLNIFFHSFCRCIIHKCLQLVLYYEPDFGYFLASQKAANFQQIKQLINDGKCKHDLVLKFIHQSIRFGKIMSYDTWEIQGINIRRSSLWLKSLSSTNDFKPWKSF